MGESQMVFRTNMPVRWVDTDALKVVHYSNYFRYVEAAEGELYRSLGFTFKKLNEEYMIAVPRVEAFCKYKAPARFGDTARVTLRLGEKKEKSIRYDFEIARESDGELLCSGYITIVALDLSNWRTTELPRDLMEKLVAVLQ